MKFPKVYFNKRELEVKEIPKRGVKVGETFSEYSLNEFVYVYSAQDEHEITRRLILLREKHFEIAKKQEVKRIRANVTRC